MQLFILVDFAFSRGKHEVAAKRPNVAAKPVKTKPRSDHEVAAKQNVGSHTGDEAF